MIPPLIIIGKNLKKATLEALQGILLCLSCDGKCDSPSHCAKYCLYVLLEIFTKTTIAFDIEKVAPNKSSVALELKACCKTLEDLEKQNVQDKGYRSPYISL